MSENFIAEEDSAVGRAATALRPGATAARPLGAAGRRPAEARSPEPEPRAGAESPRGAASPTVKPAQRSCRSWWCWHVTSAVTLYPRCGVCV